ncbi:riboflavin synthase domain-like protein [Hypoxylon sp. FL1284]|nr:riboflavin synthase domain-like protein [Hypoxylon sp. FL1284]
MYAVTLSYQSHLYQVAEPLSPVAFGLCSLFYFIFLPVLSCRTFSMTVELGHGSTNPQNGGVEAAQLEDRRMLIVYGSETGNSQDLAENLERLTERLHFKTVTCEMNDVELSTLPRYPLSIFVVSTTGQGEIPQNALKFWKSLLRKRLPPTCLQSVNFTTFGLGDSSYSKFNWAVRKLHKRLEQLGATEFYPRGEADERHEDGIDGTFLDWAQSLRSHLLREHPLPEGVSPIPPDVQLPPKFTIQLVDNMAATDSPMPGRAEGTDSALPESISTPTISTSTENGASQEPTLDRTAALFSHVDTLHPEFLDRSLQVERMLIDNNPYGARSSEGTAQQYPGGIDILDRPNVLRDHPSQYNVEDTSSTDNMTPPGELLPIPNGWRAVLRQNTRITPDTHWQDVRHLIFDVALRWDRFKKDQTNHFNPIPGDAVVIYPKNFPGDVQALIDLMGWHEVADRPFEHCARQESLLYSAPRNCYPLPLSTLRQLLLHNYDITAIPKRLFFEDIAFFTDDPTHQERLREFANPGYSDEFYDYTSRPRRSILEILHDFPSVKIPYQNVPTIFPVMRGREYSVASGGRLSKSDDPVFTRVELLVALVKYKTVLRKTREGLCSRYLACLEPGMTLAISLKEANGQGATHNDKPLLAIAPGTGVAPIRAFIWDRCSSRSHEDAVLFYGGRNKDADFYFSDEWGKLGVKVFTAFSRDQREKIYVQDRIREQADVVCQFLKNGACVYICGSSGKMPLAVRTALCDAMVIGKMAADREEAKKILHSRIPIWEEVW